MIFYYKKNYYFIYFLTEQEHMTLQILLHIQLQIQDHQKVCFFRMKLSILATLDLKL